MTDTGLTEAPKVHQPVPWWRSRWMQATVSIVVVVLIFGFLFPKLADYGEVWKTIEDMSAIEKWTLALVAVWNLMSYWPVLVAALPGLRVREAGVANLASTAVANTLPGGAAIGIGVTITMQHSWGIPVADTARAGVVSGIWNNFVKLGMPVVALALVAATGTVKPALLSAAVIGLIVLVAAVVLFALILKSDRLARSIGVASAAATSAVRRWFRRGPVVGWDDRASKFRGETVGLLTHRWLLLTVTTIISHLSLYLVLLVALRDVGVSDDEVSWIKVLAAFAFIRLLSAVPVTPGGLGVVELGLTAALGSGLPDATKNQVAAAVLLFRALTWFAPIPLGIACWLFWRSNKSWRHTVEERREVYGDVAAAFASPEPATP